MSEEEIILHKLAIDLKRDIKDIKENMSMQEFGKWVEYYNTQPTIESVSIQIAKLSELIFKANFEGEITYLDFMPTATKEDKEKLQVAYKQAELLKNLKEFGEQK